MKNDNQRDEISAKLKRRPQRTRLFQLPVPIPSRTASFGWAISKLNANHDNEHHDKYNWFETYSNITIIVIIDGRALIFFYQIINLYKHHQYHQDKNHVTDLYYPHHPAFPFLAAAAAGLKHNDLSSRIINHYQVLGKSLAKKNQLLSRIIRNIKTQLLIWSLSLCTGLPGPPTSLASLLMQGGPITQVLSLFLVISKTIKIIMIMNIEQCGPCWLHLIHADHDHDDRGGDIMNLVMMMKLMDWSCRSCCCCWWWRWWWSHSTHIYLITYPDQNPSGRGTSWRWSFNSSSKTFSPVRLWEPRNATQLTANQLQCVL